jgi:hypothetical protein
VSEDTAGASALAAEILRLYWRRAETAPPVRAAKLQRESFGGSRIAVSDVRAWRMSVQLVLRDVDRRLTPGAESGRRASDMLLDRFVGRATLRTMAEKYGSTFACMRLMTEAGALLFAEGVERRRITERVA